MPADIPKMAAIRFRGGEPVGAFLAEIIAVLRPAGIRVAGILQEEGSSDAGCCATTLLRDIADGTVIQISQELGPQARGCRLDPTALSSVASRLERAVDAGFDLLVVNRFGRAESEGSGLRAVIERAALAGTPVLIAVRDEYADAWDAFHGGMAIALTAEKDLVLAWCQKALGLSSMPMDNHGLRSRAGVARVGILTVSDRASRGEYEDVSGPAIESWLGRAITSAWTPLRRIVPDGLEPVRDALIAFCDDEGADLVLTTGGTGPAPRDLTPEAMRAVTEREMPGFGELMRRFSLETVPTAILSRQSAGVRGRTLIVNLPGKPASIAVCLDAVFPAIPYCLDLIGARQVETDPAVCQAFHPA